MSSDHKSNSTSPITKPSTSVCSTSTTTTAPSQHDLAASAAALKWGKTPSMTAPVNPETGNPMDFDNYYDEETKEKLRKKGINPALKAEMEWKKKNSEGGGIWGKVAGTAMGGGWIK